MGKKWDYDVPSIEIWKECLRVLKPGGTALIFAGSRTQHRMACNVEDAGFILKDCIMWLYGSGFPKATDISKQLDKINNQPRPTNEFKQYLKNAKKRIGITCGDIDIKLNPNGSGVFSQHYVGNNSQIEYPTIEKYQILKKLLKLDNSFDYLIEWAEAEREIIGKQKKAMSGWNIDGSTKFEDRDITLPETPEAKLWNGWKSHGLKPAYEPILVAMKPNEGTYANNALKHGVSGLNIDGGRIGKGKNKRFPANIIFDQEAAKMLDEQSGESKSSDTKRNRNTIGSFGMPNDNTSEYSDKGGASRFFYIAKASKSERNFGCEDLEEKKQWNKGGTGTGISDRENIVNRNNHPTVKPLKLMEYLCILTKTPTGGIVLDPFAGSGTTLIAAKKTGRDFIGIEREEEYCKIAEARVKAIKTDNKLFK